ncbi:MAG: hypothetical protein SH817_10460 [Leptospira sp.]|nr:hypothetical protein [Leptospira sp.]
MKQEKKYYLCHYKDRSGINHLIKLDDSPPLFMKRDGFSLTLLHFTEVLYEGEDHERERPCIFKK